MEESRRQGNRKTILVRWRSVIDLAKSVTQHLGSLKPVSFNISYTRSQTSSTIGLKTSLGQTRQTRQTRLVRTNETSRTNETRSNKRFRSLIWIGSPSILFRTNEHRLKWGVSLRTSESRLEQTSLKRGSFLFESITPTKKRRKRTQRKGGRAARQVR